MHNKLLHKEFLEILQGMAPKRADLAEEISVVLNLDKMNVYRRLRGDVKFTFGEVGALARHFRISLDDIIKNFPEGPYESIKMEFPIRPDNLGEMEDYIFPWSIPIFTKDARKHDSDTGMALNLLPRQLYMNYRHLTRYLYFRWLLFSIPDEGHTMEGTELNDKLWESCQYVAGVCREIHRTFMIWDECIITDIVNDINYHHSIDLVTDAEINILSEELYSMLDLLELWTTEGRFPDTGNKFELYLSSVGIDATINYFSASDSTSFAIMAFYIKALINTNPEVCRNMKEQINKQKTNSLLISRSGAMERREFFKRQRDAVSRLNTAPADII